VCCKACIFSVVLTTVGEVAAAESGELFMACLGRCAAVCIGTCLSFYVSRGSLYICTRPVVLPQYDIEFHIETNISRRPLMLLVAIAWIYVVLMVAVVEATGPQGSVLGAFFTVLLYGVLPLVIVGYLFMSPARKRARRAAEVGPTDETSAEVVTLDPDGGGHPAGDAVAAERKEP
jgi:hypothetical protein